MANKQGESAKSDSNKEKSLGKVVFFIGIAGIVVSLVLIFIGILFANKMDNPAHEYLALAAVIGIPVSFIIAVAGAISWYLEPFVDRIRERKRGEHNSR